jgi:hypothetical protein
VNWKKDVIFINFALVSEFKQNGNNEKSSQKTIDKYTKENYYNGALAIHKGE